MPRLYDHRARPWRDPDEPDHIECMKCGDLIEAAGSAWRHVLERRLPNRPLPVDTAVFDEAVELSVTVVANLPADATDFDKVYAVVDFLYWRGALRPRGWKRPDQLRRRAA